jgi:hypothetical protein
MRKLILVALTALVLSACKTTEEAMREARSRATIRRPSGTT